MRRILLRLQPLKASGKLLEAPSCKLALSAPLPNCFPLPHICRKSLWTSSIALSGHSKWATIKHDKGRNDKIRGAEFSRLSRDIITAAKMSGPDSLRLKQAMAAAKKAGMVKEKIEGAVRKGLGITAEGVEYESVTIEAMGPGGVAIMIDCLTDNKLRTIQNVKHVVSKNGGTVTPIAYMFSRKGKIALSAASEFSSNFDELFEQVLEKTMEIDGVEDVEAVEEDGQRQIQVTTQPDKVKRVSEEVAENIDVVKVEKYAVEWIPNEETMVLEGGGEEWNGFEELISKIEAEDDVEEVYTNIRVSR